MSVTSLRVSSLKNTNASTNDHVDPLAQLPKSTQSRGHDDEDTITSDERTTSPSSHREGSGSHGAASDAPAQQERFLPGEFVSKRFPRHVKAMATLLRSLSKDIVRASLMAGPTSNTQSIRQEVERLICAICCVYWNDDIVLELCGSYATATALRDSDLNISLSSRKPHHLLERPELYVNQLHEFINLHLRGVLASSISGGTRSSGLRLYIQCYATWSQLQSLNTVMTNSSLYQHRDFPRALLNEVSKVVYTITSAEPEVGHRRHDHHHDNERHAHHQRARTMAITVSVDHSRAVNHALYFNQLVSGFPELTSFLIFLKAHCADAGIDSAQMTSSLLTWTAVAYFRNHLLQLGTSRSSPGQVFLAFLDYFREGGAFDPRVHWLCPGHPCGIVQSSTAATQSMWMVLDPFLSHERIDACAAAAFTGPHQELAAFNLASSCYMTHVFRRSLGVVLQRVLYEYGDAIVPGGCTRFILSPLDSKVNFAPLTVTFGEGAAAPRRFVQSIDRLITTVLPHMMPHHHDTRHHAQGAQHSRCNN